MSDITWPQQIKLYKLLRWRYEPDSLQMNRALKKIVKTKGSASALIEKLEKPEHQKRISDEEVERILLEAIHEK